MDKKKDDLDLTKMHYNCAPSSQTFGESGEFLRQSNSFKHPSKYFDEGRLFHNASTVSDNVSAIPWKNESPLSEINESMLCDNNMPSQIKKKIFGFSEDQYQKPIDRSDSSKILSSEVHSDYIASLRRVNSQDGRPISTNTSLRSTLLDYESRNSSRFSNPRHSARGKKRTLSASPFSSEIFDLAEIIRTSPNSLVAYVTSNDANGFVSRGSGRNSSAASRASNGSFGHLSIGSVRSSPIGVSKARSQLTVSFDSIHQREKQYNELNQRNQQNQLNQYPLNYSYVQNNSNLDSLTMLLNYQQESSKNSLQKSETQASSVTFSSKSSPSDVLQAACKNQRTSLYVPNTVNLVPHPPVSQHRKLVNIGDELKNEQRSSLCKDNSNARPNVFIEEDDHTGRNQIEETKPSGDAESEEEESGPVDLCCGWKNCSIKFDSQLQLVHHVNTDHIQKNKKDCSCYWQGCSRGEKSFKAMYMLVVHVRRHTGEKPHKCHYKDCKKAYSRLENLKTHLRSHTGERPYLCEIPGCNKAFSNASDRAKHQNRTHSDVKQYGCKVDGCSKRYTDPSSLRKHMKTVHSVLPQPTKKFRGERPLSGKKPFEGQTNSSNHNTEIRMAKHLKSEPSQNHFNTKKQTPPSNNIIKSTSPLYYTDSDFPNALNEISSHYDISELNYHQPCNARDTEVQLQVSSPRVISSSIKPINLAAEELINQRYSIISSRNLSNRRVSNGSVGSLESNNSSGYESYSNSRRESDMSLQLTGEKYSSVLMNQIVKDVSPRSNAKNFLKELLSETISEDNNSNYFELINRGSCISSGYGSKNNYFPLSKSPEKPNNLSSLNFRRASEGNANRISDIQQNKSPHFRRCSEPVEVTSLIENTPRRHSMTSYNKLPLAPSMNQTSMEVEMKNSILPICQPEENEVQLSRFIQNNEIVMSKPDIQSLLVTHPKDQNTFSTKGSSSLKKQFEVGSRVSDEDFSRYSNVDPLTSFVENYDMAEPNEDVWYDLFHQTNRASAHNLSTPIHSFQNENENNNSQLNKKIDGLRNTYLSEHLQYLQPNYASEKQCNNPQTKNQLQNQRMYDVCGEFLQNKQEKPNDLTLKWRDSHFSRQQTKFDSNAINVEDLLSTNLDALCTETINDGPTTNMVLNTMDILLDSFVEENIFYENQAFRRFSVIYE